MIQFCLIGRLVMGHVFWFVNCFRGNCKRKRERKIIGKSFLNWFLWCISQIYYFVFNLHKCLIEKFKNSTKNFNLSNCSTGWSKFTKTKWVNICIWCLCLHHVYESKSLGHNQTLVHSLQYIFSVDLLLLVNSVSDYSRIKQCSIQNFSSRNN